MKCWVCIEAGQLDSAAVLVADLIEQAERHGLEQFRVIGAILQASVSGLAALGAEELEPTRLAHRITTMTTFVDTSRMVGLNLYLTFNDAVLGRLLMAAAQPEQTRNRLDTGLRLAKDTGCASTTPNFCGCAPTLTPTPRPVEPTSAPPSPSPAARARRCSNCPASPRAALADVVSCFPRDGAWPELARAQASLSEHSPRL